MSVALRSTLVLAAVLATTPATAQPAPAPAPAPSAAADTADDTPLAHALTGEAKALYDIGRASFRAGDSAAALANFQRADERSGDPRLLWNMAACEASLKHWARAMTLVDRYVASGASLLSDRDREQAIRFRTAATRFVATVDLTTDPGVTVTVDGENVGATPLGSSLYLDAGKRRITFSKPGFRGVVRVETVSGGSTLTWSVPLERLRIRILGT